MHLRRLTVFIMICGTAFCAIAFNVYGEESPEPALLQDTAQRQASPVDTTTQDILPEPEPESNLRKQADAETSALPDPITGTDPLAGTGLRLRLDSIHLDKLYEAVKKESTRETVRMTMEECIATALTNNQDILIAQFTPWKSDADIMSARGQFDPSLNISYQDIRASQQNSTEIQVYGGLSAMEVYRKNYQASLGGLLPWGTEYTMSSTFTPERTTYNDFDTEWSGNLSLSLTQPLLRGRGKPANMTRIWQARNSREQADSQVRLQVMNTVGEVINSYWDLVGAIEQAKVSQESLANAERLLDLNEKRVKIGTTAVVEVVQAKAGVASRQSDLIAARSRIKDAEDRLKNLILMTDGQTLSPARIEPIDRPALRELDLDEDESISKAFTNRPDIAIALLSVESAGMERKRARNDLLPQVDITGAVTRGGRGGVAADVWDGAIEKRDYTYTIGVRGTVPIGNRVARGAYHRAKLTEGETAQRLEKAKQDTVLSVRLAIRQVATNWLLVEANKQTLALQQTNVEAQMKRLELGMTTSFEVLQTQSDLSAAQTQELQSIIAYEKSLVDLQTAEGVLLDDLAIVFEPVDSEPPLSYFESLNPFPRQ